MCSESGVIFHFHLIFYPGSANRCWTTFAADQIVGSRPNSVTATHRKACPTASLNKTTTSTNVNQDASETFANTFVVNKVPAAKPRPPSRVAYYSIRNLAGPDKPFQSLPLELRRDYQQLWPRYRTQNHAKHLECGLIFVSNDTSRSPTYKGRKKITPRQIADTRPGAIGHLQDRFVRHTAVAFLIRVSSKGSRQ